MNQYPFLMKSNKIILIVIFFLISYFLFYRTKSGPIGGLWKAVVSVFEPGHTQSEERNPYKAPEPDIATATNNGRIEDVATADNTQKEDEKETSIFTKIKDKVFNNDTESSTGSNDLPAYALPAIQKGDQIVKHKNYTLNYVEDYEQAAWVVHRLRGEYTQGRASRSQLEFVPDRMVKTNSALTSDYSGSGYDRGHLVPAGDFKCCQDLMTETFYVSNISPQVPDFNRGIWENLESRMRGWAVRDDEIIIATGPVLRDGLPTIGRYNQIAIPEYYYKIALYYPENEPERARAIAFLLPNKALFGEKLPKYVVSINKVEEVTGIDFFAKLPDAIEQRLEQQADWKAWTKVQ